MSNHENDVRKQMPRFTSGDTLTTRYSTRAAYCSCKAHDAWPNGESVMEQYCYVPRSCSSYPLAVPPQGSETEARAHQVRLRGEDGPGPASGFFEFETETRKPKKGSISHPETRQSQSLLYQSWEELCRWESEGLQIMSICSS
jgi:hypothetical protein